LGDFFEGGAEGEGRGVVYDLNDREVGWLHADEAWGWLIVARQAGDGGCGGFVRGVVGRVG